MTDPPRPWQVYILRCADGTLYTGIARDAQARFDKHQAGRGARYTRGRGPLELLHVEPAASHGDALRREAEIRRLGREGKEALCARSRHGERGLRAHGPPGGRAAVVRRAVQGDLA